MPLPMVLELVRKRSSAGRACFVPAAPPNWPPSTAKGEACAEACGADGFLGIPSFSKLPRVRVTLRVRARVRDTVRVRARARARAPNLPRRRAPQLRCLALARR